MRRPGIEPGSIAWKAINLPLKYRRIPVYMDFYFHHMHAFNKHISISIKISKDKITGKN